MVEIPAGHLCPRLLADGQPHLGHDALLQSARRRIERRRLQRELGERDERFLLALRELALQAEGRSKGGKLCRTRQVTSIGAANRERSARIAGVGRALGACCRGATGKHANDDDAATGPCCRVDQPFEVLLILDLARVARRRVHHVEVRLYHLEWWM